MKSFTFSVFLTFFHIVLLLTLNLPTFLQAQEKSTFPLKFSASLANRYDKVYKYIPQGRLVLTDHFKILFDVDLESMPASDLELKARLSVSKYWNQWMTQNELNPGQFNYNLDEKFRNDQVHLSLAYMIYSPATWFAMYGGRLPVIDGSPVHYYRGEKSSAILPKLTFGAEVDGALLFFNINFFKFYAGYLPFLLQNYAYQTTSVNQKPYVTNSQTEAETLAPRAALGLTTEFSNVLAAKRLWGVIHYSWTNYLRFPDASTDASFFDSTLSGNSQLTSSLQVSIRNLLAHVEFDELFNSSFSFSASYLMTFLNSNGAVTVSSGVGAGRNLGGYGTTKNDEVLNGGILLLAAKYKLPLENIKFPTIGVEYLNSTKDGFFYDRNPDDPAQFYATRGQGLHAYYLQPLGKNLNLRGGFRRQEYTHLPWALGDSVASAIRFDTYYLDVKAIF